MSSIFGLYSKSQVSNSQSDLDKMAMSAHVKFQQDFPTEFPDFYKSDHTFIQEGVEHAICNQLIQNV